MSNLHDRPRFQREQLVEYCSRLYRCQYEVGEQKLQDIELLVESDPLEALFCLQRRHLATFPFSSLVLHYSQHHSISLEPDVLFEKMVKRGLGGYCVENTGMFAIVLRTLGFQFYPTGARVSKSLAPGPENADFYGFGHEVLILVIKGIKYMVDVGFGPQGPTQPLLLKDGEPETAGLLQMSVVLGNIRPNTDANQRLWQYRFRRDASSEWAIAYCFYDIEFLPDDFERMNWMASQHHRSHFVQNFIFTIFILNETENTIDRCLVLFRDIVKEYQNGKYEILKNLASEEERISALKDFFNVHLEPMEISGIRGMSTEIKAV